MLHDTVSLLVAMLALWAIVSPRVPTGVFITAGLGAVFVVSVWSIDDGFNSDVALDLLLGALSMIGVGVAWRCARRYPRAMRRADDWKP